MEDSYEIVADFYDEVVEYRDRPDVSFFVEMAQASRGPVLELGCGTGRVLIPTARAGMDIVGVDLSRSMLNVCAQKLQHESSDVRSRVQLLLGDMRSSRQYGPLFSLVTIPFRPFQHLVKVDDQLACLRSIHENLRDDGRLVVDVFNPNLKLMMKDNLGIEYHEGPGFVLPDGRNVARYAKHIARDFINQVLTIELIYDATSTNGDKERFVQRIQARYFFRYEMEHLLARAGFEVAALYGDYERHPFSDEYSSELIFVARKAR